MKTNKQWLYYLFLSIPFLDTYSLGFGDFAVYSCVICTIYAICTNTYRFTHKLFFILSVFVVMHELFLWLSPFTNITSQWVNSVIGTFLFVITINMFSKQLNITILYKIWKAFGIVIMAGMVYHCIMVYVFRQPVTFIHIPFLPETSKNIYENILSGYYSRPVSFFTEPSHYASYMLPLLYLNLMFNDKKYAICNALLMLLSTSTLGMLMTVYFFAAFLTTGYSMKNRIIIIIAIIIGIIAFLNLDIFEFARNKFSASGGNDESSKLRLLFGIDLWMNLPNELKFWGITDATIGEFLTHNNKYIPSYLSWILDDDSSLNYQSSFWLVSIKYGIIGQILYISMFFSFIRKTKHFPLITYAIYIAIAPFYQSCFMNSIFLTQIVLMLLIIKDKKLIYEELRSNNLIRK